MLNTASNCYYAQSAVSMKGISFICLFQLDTVKKSMQNKRSMQNQFGLDKNQE
jgi:hypothetical protein